jgi:hypothetical protein
MPPVVDLKSKKPLIRAVIHFSIGAQGAVQVKVGNLPDGGAFTRHRPCKCLRTPLRCLRRRSWDF